MAKSINQISIFISSPSDVNAERESARKVIEELNKTLCVPNGLLLFSLTWEDNTYPAIGEYSQDVINKQIREYDIFVGIMGNRFGSPTPNAGSGTEEEFNIAYKNRSNTQIMFFFKDAPITPSSLDLSQLDKVRKFKEKIGNDGVYYFQFSEDFEKVFRERLTMYLSDKYISTVADRPKSDKQLCVGNDAELPISSNKINLYLDKYIQPTNPTYIKNEYIQTLAFPQKRFKLKNVYVPLSLVKMSNLEKYEEIVKIDKLPVDLIEKYKKILITGTAGMGKSTIMKFMFNDLIENRISDFGFPIFIELNRLNKDHTILMEIQNELNFFNKECINDSLSDFIQKGGFIFFLDGFDEIPIADSSIVTQDIQTFISNAEDGNYFILTSRPVENLASFGNFQSFTIKPLTTTEGFNLLSKYDKSNHKQFSEELIKVLNSGYFDTYNEYLDNPLLFTLLFNIFNSKRSIPIQKRAFFEQTYSAFFEMHDKSKNITPHEKRSGLNSEEFSRVLKCVGFICYMEIGARFREETILIAIERAKSFYSDISFNCSDFFIDLLVSVPLFCKDGNEYKWGHESLIVYFAVLFIAEEVPDRRDILLNEIYKSHHLSRYNDFLDLYYEIDVTGFSKCILLPFLEEYLEYYNENFVLLPTIDMELIEARIGLSFGLTKIGIIKNKYYDFEKKIAPFIGTKNGLSRNEMLSIKDYAKYKGVGVYSLDRYFVIMNILYKKIPSLFKCYTQKTIYDNKKQFERDKVYEISLMTGSNNENDFILINTILFLVSSDPIRTKIFKENMGKICFLDSNAVKREIEYIKTSIIGAKIKDLLIDL